MMTFYQVYTEETDEVYILTQELNTLQARIKNAIAFEDVEEVQKLQKQINKLINTIYRKLEND